MAGTERRLNHYGSLNQDRGLDDIDPQFYEQPAHAARGRHATLVEDVARRMTITSVSSGEPTDQPNLAARGKFNVSNLMPPTKPANPYTGDYNYSGIEL